MAEEMKNEEVLSDEVLEEVAGGTKKEIKKDIEMLKHYGYLRGIDSPSIPQINDAILAIGREVGLKMGYNPDYNNKNKYYINHDSHGQEYFWNEIRDRKGY